MATVISTYKVFENSFLANTEEHLESVAEQRARALEQVTKNVISQIEEDSALSLKEGKPVGDLLKGVSFLSFNAQTNSWDVKRSYAKVLGEHEAVLKSQNFDLLFSGLEVNKLKLIQLSKPKNTFVVLQKKMAREEVVVSSALAKVNPATIKGDNEPKTQVVEKEGIVFIELKLHAFMLASNILKTLSSEQFIINEKGFIFAHADVKYIGADLGEHPVALQVIKKSGVKGSVEFQEEGGLKKGFYKKIKNTNLYTVVVEKALVGFTPTRQVYTELFIILGAVFLIVIVLLMTMLKSSRRESDFILTALKNVVYDKQVLPTARFKFSEYGESFSALHQLVHGDLENLSKSESVEHTENQKKYALHQTQYRILMGAMQSVSNNLLKSMGHLQLAKETAKGPQLTHLKVAEEEARKGRNLITHIRYHEGIQRENKQEINLSEYIPRILSEDFPQIEVLAEKPKSLVFTDPDQLKRLILEVTTFLSESYLRDDDKISLKLEEKAGRILLHFTFHHFAFIEPQKTAIQSHLVGVGPFDSKYEKLLACRGEASSSFTQIEFSSDNKVMTLVMEPTKSIQKEIVEKIADKSSEEEVVSVETKEVSDGDISNSENGVAKKELTDKEQAEKEEVMEFFGMEPVAEGELFPPAPGDVVEDDIEHQGEAKAFHLETAYSAPTVTSEDLLNDINEMEQGLEASEVSEVIELTAQESASSEDVLEDLVEDFVVEGPKKSTGEIELEVKIRKPKTKSDS